MTITPATLPDAPIRSIDLHNIHMSYKTSHSRNHVLRGLNLSVPNNRNLGILGRNGAGKSTMINILSGLLEPDRGTVNHNGIRLSWPIGRPAFQGSLSAYNNLKFVCRVMGVEIQPVLDFVQDFAELGDYMYMPVKTFSSGMKSRLGFALSMVIDCDCLLVDEGFGAGDARFRNKMNDVFEQRRAGKNMICVSHNGGIIRRFCDYVGVLNDGILTIYDDLDEGFAIYENL